MKEKSGIEKGSSRSKSEIKGGLCKSYLVNVEQRQKHTIEHKDEQRQEREGDI